jgi:glucose/arabinose dehydrogenase
MNPMGGESRGFAAGLRNCAGLATRPDGALWCVVNERDMLGDDLPPDYAAQVKPGGFYGWPWFYIGAHEDPSHQGARPELKDKVATPDILLQAHSAPLSIAFYDGAMFPTEYKGDAFVALHGSWNRSGRVGYKVVRLRFSQGAATGEFSSHLAGFDCLLAEFHAPAEAAEAERREHEVADRQIAASLHRGNAS